MGTYDIKQDAPGLLRTEALNMTLRFDRTGPTTGRVSWNVPSPAAGCTAETQAYNGIVVVLDTTPPTASKLPGNGVVYTADPTATTSLHAGDKLGTGLIIGAIYQDIVTTFFDVSGLVSNGAYYVSGYPVDAQHRYYREGIHSFSLALQTETSELHHDTTGSQAIEISTGPSTTGVDVARYTGLVPGITYEFDLQLGVIPKSQSPTNTLQSVPVTPTHRLGIRGNLAATYGNLVNEINHQISLIDAPVLSGLPPNTNAYYFDVPSKRLFAWDGSNHTQQEFIEASAAPNVVSDGTYWHNLTDSKLYLRLAGTWVEVIVIETSYNPITPPTGAIWVAPTAAYTRDGNTWCKTPLYVQETDPSLSPTLVGGTFWYSPSSGTLNKWFANLHIWGVVTAVQYHEDPTALPDGTLWLNDITNTLSLLTAGGWNMQSNTSFVENAPTVPSPGRYWYNPVTQELHQRNQANTAWVYLDVIVYSTDPTEVEDCGLWWNTDTDVLYVYNGVGSSWAASVHLYQQDIDPTQDPTMLNGSVWYNPTTRNVRMWEDVCFKNSEAVIWPHDPTEGGLLVGTVWYNPASANWQVLSTVGWSTINPIAAPMDLTTLPLGAVWYNTLGMSLQVWNGIMWVSVAYSTAPLTPAVGSRWFNTSTLVLMEWSKDGWVVAPTRATCYINQAGNIEIVDNNPGSLSFVNITDVSLFNSLNDRSTPLNPVPGTDGVSVEPSYQQLGVGTDGSPDERLRLMNEIRYELGYPAVDVELAPEQLDLCITKALEELRTRSSVAYKHGFFFMHVNAETQRYILSNKTQGMNKIVTVQGVYRLTSSFLSSAHGAGVYGQIVMQHLYNMGTFDLLSYHIMSEYTELMEILFAGRITFSWDEQKRELWVHHRFPFQERMVLIEASTERTEQDIITDRWCKAWIRKWASAAARLMLAESRGKYSSLPGAGGGTTLNAGELRQKASDDFDSCLADLENYVVDKPDDFGMGVHFVLG